MLITWEICSHPWLGGRDPITLLIDSLVTGKPLQHQSYYWKPAFSFSFLHEGRCWGRRGVSEGDINERGRKKKSHNTEKEFKIGWSSGTGKYLARACGQKVSVSVRLQWCLWDKKHIFVISFPNNIKFLNIFPYQGWKEAWEPQNSPRGMQNYYILMRLAHTASAGTGTTVLRKCRKSYELFLRQSSEPKLAAQH